eukprot:symbB.v1.2.016814.t1/scaffold1293.1/size126329/2
MKTAGIFACLVFFGAEFFGSIVSPSLENELMAKPSSCVPLLLARLDGEAEIRRAAAKGICALMKRAPHAELWKVTTVCGVLEALPGESIALDFLIAALKLTDGELSQTLQEAACAFLEDCHFQDARQEQVQEMLLVLKAPHLRI